MSEPKTRNGSQKMQSIVKGLLVAALGIASLFLRFWLGSVWVEASVYVCLLLVLIGYLLRQCDIVSLPNAVFLGSLGVNICIVSFIAIEVSDIRIVAGLGFLAGAALSFLKS